MDGVVQDPHFLFVLKRELARRCSKNPQYSLRAFAASLGSDVGYLSRILSGQRLPSFKRAAAFATRLCLSPRNRNRFIESITDARKALSLGLESVTMRATRVNPTELENDIYDHLTALHNLALLELTFVDNYQSDVRWMAKQLGITTIEVRLAIERMKRLGLMIETDSVLRACNTDTTTQDKAKTSTALKLQQKEILSRAIDSLMHDHIFERSMSGMTMAIDPEKLPMAKAMIQDFMEELACVLGAGRKVQIYQLGVSLYPLQPRSLRNAAQ